MKIFKIFILVLALSSISMPAFAASWSPLQKGKCDTVSGKRIYKAKLKRNFGDDPSGVLCERLQKTVNGKSRVPDQCVKRGLNGHSGIWLVSDNSCPKTNAKNGGKRSGG